MKKYLIILLLSAFLAGLFFYFDKKNDSFINNSVIPKEVFDFKGLETNKGFIRYVDGTNGTYYAHVDFTEKQSCITPEEDDLDCEGSPDTKNENKEAISVPIALDVSFFDVGCYFRDSSSGEDSFIKLEVFNTFVKEMSTFPDSKCGHDSGSSNNRLYFFEFNSKGEITSIASDQIYNQ